MTQFLGDIAWTLELFTVAVGLVLLHFAARESAANLLRAAGWLLVVGGAGAALCTGYYWFSYQAQGQFDAVHAHAPLTMQMPVGSMTPGGNNMAALRRGAQPASETEPEVRIRR